MKYLEKSVGFFLKHWIIAVPLFVLMAIPALITGTAGSLTDLTEVWSSIRNPSQINDLSKIFTLAGLVLPMIVGGGILSFIFQFISMPATYGLVNNGLDTGISDLNNIGHAISTNFVKYLMYFVGTLVIWLAFSIASFVVIGIFMLIRLYLITVLLFIIFGIAAAVLSVLLALWFSAMVVDNLDVYAAAKKSVEIAKSSFWTILGVTILIAVASAIAGGILSFLNVIPLLGPIIASIVPAAAAFIKIIFYLMFYRDKTGRLNT